MVHGAARRTGSMRVWINSLNFKCTQCIVVPAAHPNQSRITSFPTWEYITFRFYTHTYASLMSVTFVREMFMIIYILRAYIPIWKNEFYKSIIYFIILSTDCIKYINKKYVYSDETSRSVVKQNAKCNTVNSPTVVLFLKQQGLLLWINTLRC